MQTHRIQSHRLASCSGSSAPSAQPNRIASTHGRRVIAARAATVRMFFTRTITRVLRPRWVRREGAGRGEPSPPPDLFGSIFVNHAPCARFRRRASLEDRACSVPWHPVDRGRTPGPRRSQASLGVSARPGVKAIGVSSRPPRHPRTPLRLGARNRAVLAILPPPPVPFSWRTRRGARDPRPLTAPRPPPARRGARTCPPRCGTRARRWRRTRT